MLSLFPYFLTFQGFSPLLLRVTLGLIFIMWGYKIFKKEKSRVALTYSGVQILVGFFFIIGLFTQLMALMSVVFFGIKIYEKINKKLFMTDGVNYYFILLIISLSLFLTGPGFIAFDLPL